MTSLIKFCMFLFASACRPGCLCLQNVHIYGAFPNSLTWFYMLYMD